MAETKTFQVLLKDGWSLAVKADHHQLERPSSSGGMPSEAFKMDVVSFRVDNREVCFVPGSQVVAIVETESLVGVPTRLGSGTLPGPIEAGNGKSRKS